MRRVCAERGLDTAAAEGRLGHEVGWEFMVSGEREKKGLVWCHVFKSASSRSVNNIISQFRELENRELQ